jgi:hypothetical protein
MTTEVAKAAVAPIMFVELFFASGVVRCWNGIGAVTWNGSTWVGTGELLSISSIEETKSIESTQVTITLSGVPSALVAVAYGDFSQGRTARVYLGMMNVAAGTIIADPIQIFGGRLDTISDQDDGESATLTVSAESNLADLDRLRVRFFTDQDQQRIFESDRSLRFMASVQDRPVYWGTANKVGTPTATKL